MDKSQSVVAWRRHDTTLEFRVEGWGTMPQSLAIRRWVENQPPPAVQTLRIDLAHCTYMDSTFIGTLIFLKRLLAKAQGSFVLIHPSPECRQLLMKMGIARPSVSSMSPRPAITPRLAIGKPCLPNRCLPAPSISNKTSLTRISNLPTKIVAAIYI